MSPVSRHQGLAEISQKLLKNARVSAKANNDYDSKTTRDELTAIYKTISGHEIRDWQLNVAEALVLGLDCVAIAGTGSGKTVPFTIPLLLPRYKDKIAYIISPLKTLQEEQVFKSFRGGWVAVNGDTWNDTLAKELDENSYRGIFTGPEMILKFDKFKKWMEKEDTLARVLFIAVDEAHCISTWGKDFRKEFHVLLVE